MPARIATPARNAVSTAGWRSVAGGNGSYLGLLGRLACRTGRGFSPINKRGAGEASP